MQSHLIAVCFCLFSWLAVAGAQALAAGRAELEVYTEERVPITAQHEWLRELSQAGISSVRIRARHAGDELGIATRGTSGAPVYVVTGAIVPGNELIVPGARFRLTEARRLARWLDELAEQGPPSQREGKAAFGLKASQLERLHEELARPVGFSTKDVGRREVVERIARSLRVAVAMDAGVAGAMGGDKVPAELSDLSCGTALAYVLRAPGLCLVPRPTAGGAELAVVRSQPNLEIWPIGWEPEKSLPELAPGLYEFLNVNVQNVTVTTVLDAISQRAKLPVLIDQNALARHGIEPDKAAVNLPQSRTTYSLALRKVLFQGGLKFEVRVDEAGKPFLWVSSVKPLD
ncbi:MAG: hypothetical protein HUU20_04545 [Pirellulales bacterium]|nr:hypothetical protein [Pirellulales bacterium]